MVSSTTAFLAGAGVAAGVLVYLKHAQPTNPVFNYLSGRNIQSLQAGGTACQNLWEATSQVCGNPCPPCSCPQNPEQGFGFYGQGMAAPVPPTYTSPATPTPGAFRRVPIR